MVELLRDTVGALEGMLGSPWLWGLVFVLSALDALLPFMPSELSVVAVGVLVYPDPASLGLLVVLAATGAFLGDCLGYLIGRRAGPGVLGLLQRGARGRAVRLWGQQQFARRGATVVAVGRYVPGGRVTSMISAGILGYPVRRFLVADAVGVCLWATYASLLGYLGGVTFANDPLYGLLLALGLGLAIGALIEVSRLGWARRSAPNAGRSKAPAWR